MKNRIIELVDLLNKARDEYYNGIDELMTDGEYDKLYDELESLEKEFGLVMPNSPTQTVGYEVRSKLEKVRHSHPMLSLDKTKNWNEFLNYFSGKDVIGMLKLDGLTCSLEYNDGKLVSAETRGNGVIGEDILHNARVISSIPTSIPYKDKLIVDGEIICTESDFKEFSEEYKNPRNFASGSIRLLDSRECAKRNLTFLVWNIIEGFSETKSFLEKLNLIEKNGFNVVPWTSSFDWDAKEFLIEQSKKLGYPIDGLVGRFDDIEYGNKLGNTSHHSRAAYAFKFADEDNETILRDVEWTMGKTNKIVPTAIFDPVEVLGTTVSKAFIHNVSIFKKLQLGIGDTITIIKSNEIIPQIKENLTRSGTCEIPKVCPVCGAKTIVKKENESEALFCTNVTCSGKFMGRLEQFVSKEAMNIDGLSGGRLQAIVDAGLITSFKDIYNLHEHKNELMRIDRMGNALVRKIIKSIEVSRNTTLSRFICALSIPMVGRNASKVIQKYIEKTYKDRDPFEAFIELTEKRFGWSALEAFGDKMSYEMNAYFRDNLAQVKELAKELKFQREEDINKNAFGNGVAQQASPKIKNKIFVITGSLNHYSSRDVLKEEIEALGGKVVGSVSSKTNYLICNSNDNTGKYKKAQELGIKCITEEEYISMKE